MPITHSNIVCNFLALIITIALSSLLLNITKHTGILGNLAVQIVLSQSAIVVSTIKAYRSSYHIEFGEVLYNAIKIWAWLNIGLLLSILTYRFLSGSEIFTLLL